jgi:DNA-binding NarL/FixJ family response regulator
LAAGPAAQAGWGDPQRWLFDAEAWASRQGLEGVAASCRAELRGMGAAPQRRRSRTAVPPTLRPYGLTGREVDVLALLPDGLSNAAIAERLHISPGTVKGYVEHLLAKTGASNRSALATLAVEHGLGTNHA